MSGVREAYPEQRKTTQSTGVTPGRTDIRTSWSEAGSDNSISHPDQADALAQLVEAQIIPRLLLVHKANAADFENPKLRAEQKLTKADVQEFANIVLSHDSDVSTAYVEALYAQGFSAETLLLQLLAPAARQFGTMWEDDSADFMTVTLGLSRLQQTMRRFRQTAAGELAESSANQRILLTTTPGDQHSFGLSMVAEFFRTAGWDVHDDPTMPIEEQLELIRSKNFAVVGLSLSSEVFIETLVECMHSIRQESRNRGVLIIVGGQLFQQHPELVATVGADATAADGKTAVQEAYNLLGLKANRAC